MQSGAGVRGCGGGVEAKDTGGETSRFAQFTEPANWLSGHGSRIEALRDDDRENVIRLELVIRRDLTGKESAEVMKIDGNNAVVMKAQCGRYNEVAIVGVVENGRLEALAMEPRHIDVQSSKEDLDAIMEDAKRGMWSALEMYKDR